MTLNNIKTLQRERGFTIVELLIVIVVIGILAAIVIVAYNGVTNNAKDSNDKSNATQIAKVAETINADKGYYPGGTGDAAVTSTATLTTSFNQGTTSKLPNGVSVIYLVGGGAEPNFTTVRDNSDNSKSYTVEVCGTTNGITVFYAKRSDSTVQKVNAGTGC